MSLAMSRRYRASSFRILVCLVSVLSAASVMPVATAAPAHYILTPLPVPAQYGEVLTRDIADNGTVLAWLVDTGAAGAVFDRTGSWTFTIPGALFLDPVAITNGGTIFGNYGDTSGNWMFRRSPAGVVTPIAIDGTWTYANIWNASENGIVVGQACASVDPPCVGFIRTTRGTVLFEAPGAVFTYLTGVNNAGTTVGLYDDGMGGGGTFVRSANGTLSPIAIPGATGIFPVGINNREDVVGMYSDDITWHGFVLRDGEAITVDLPLPATLEYDDPATGTVVALQLQFSSTTVFSINDRGDIVGTTSGHYRDDAGTIFLERRFPFTGRLVP